MQNRAIVSNIDAHITERELYSLLQCTVEPSSLSQKGLVAVVRSVHFIGSPQPGDEVEVVGKPGESFVVLNADLIRCTAFLRRISAGGTLFAWIDTMRPISQTAYVEYKLENTAQRAVSRLDGKLIRGRRLHVSMVNDKENAVLVKRLAHVDGDEQGVNQAGAVHEFSFGEGLPVEVSLQTDSSSTGTGGVLWDAALFLAEWLHCNRSRALYGKTVLELGAGLGLPSLLAAHHADHVIMTDYVKETLDLMRLNITRNGVRENASVFNLDWHSHERDLNAIMAAHSPNVLIFSDVVYSLECAQLLPEVIRQLLPPAGECAVALV
jgi:hypothetical protein